MSYEIVKDYDANARVVFVVERRGPRGGRRRLAAYSDIVIATLVAQSLGAGERREVSVPPLQRRSRGVQGELAGQLSLEDALGPQEGRESLGEAMPFVREAAMGDEAAT